RQDQNLQLLLFAARKIATTFAALRGHSRASLLLVQPQHSLVFRHSRGSFATRAARSALLVRARGPSARLLEPGPAPAGQRRQLPRVLSQARASSLAIVSERGVTSNGPRVLVP